MAPAPLAAPGRPGMVGPDPRLDPRGDRDLRVSMGDRDMRQPQPLEDQDLRTGGDPRFRAGAPFDPRSRPFAPQGPPGGPAPIGGRDDPRMGPGPARPGGNPVISAQDQEKAALIMQVRRPR